MLYFSSLFGKELYMFRTDLLSIIRGLDTVLTTTGICHASYVASLLAPDRHISYPVCPLLEFINVANFRAPRELNNLSLIFIVLIVSQAINYIILSSLLCSGLYLLLAFWLTVAVYENIVMYFVNSWTCLLFISGTKQNSRKVSHYCDWLWSRWQAFF